MSIDYGLGQTNIDRATGIRYGVISQNSILQAWADSSEAVYPCGDCDCEGEYAAEDCDAEPSYYHYKGDGYRMTTCLDTDVMVMKSPFYTFAPFCSPCVPGAVNLDSADTHEAPLVHGKPYSDLPQGYCPGHDWFEDGVAPYPVFGMVSGRPCFPDTWYGHAISWERHAIWLDICFGMPEHAQRTDYCAYSGHWECDNGHWYYCV